MNARDTAALKNFKTACNFTNIDVPSPVFIYTEKRSQGIR